MKPVLQYQHHGADVWVREDLKGKHWDYCLCRDCAKLNTGDRDKNCPIANALYDNCVKFNVVTPVWECPAFNKGESGHERNIL